MSDDEFMDTVRLSGRVFKKEIKCYRSKLGEIFRVPPEKIYPDDSFGELSDLLTSDWDILEIVLFLEDILEVDLDETKVPEWNLKTTLGQWITDLLSRCFPQLIDNPGNPG